ncbi:hypothetical protein K7432_010119 [Basidiobolus ranarum]|uniref:RRM domain-containing protein n=1 Tax=Basidiobolus ranarum TaxID=34480 RepID=A0ABR2WP91_9FUNG
MSTLFTATLPKTGLRIIQRTYATKTIFVANLPRETTHQDLKLLFSNYGSVYTVKHAPRQNFGFVIMESSSASKAIEAAKGYRLHGNVLKVKESQPRKK